MIEAKSHIDWPSRGRSCGTPDLSKQACTGKWRSGAQPAVQAEHHDVDQGLPSAGCRPTVDIAIDYYYYYRQMLKIKQYYAYRDQSVMT